LGGQGKVGIKMKDWWLQILGLVLSHVSGPLREVMVKAVQEWEAKAKETKDPWDDLFVFFVKCLLLIP